MLAKKLMISSFIERSMIMWTWFFNKIDHLVALQMTWNVNVFTPTLGVENVFMLELFEVNWTNKVNILS